MSVPLATMLAPECGEPPATIGVPVDAGHSYIDGAWHTNDPAGRSLLLYDPSLAVPLTRLVCAGPREVDLAVAAARRAFVDELRHWSEPDRSAALRRLATAIESRRDAFARCIAAEIGAPVDFGRVAQIDRACAYIAATLSALAVDAGEPAVRHEPAGVAALITAWNWPLNQMVAKVAAAWAAGCAVVLKPSERTPRTAALFVECVEAAGVPRGALNVVLGDGRTGAALAGHRGVDVISFTGATQTGRGVARLAAMRLRPITLELGGKSARIVFPDATVDRAALDAVQSCFRNSGQTCNAGSRLIVHRSIYPATLEAVRAATDAIVLGSAHETGAHLGPVASAEHKAAIDAIIAQAKRQGARLLCGGEIGPDDPPLGSFVRPTVFADVTPAMRLFRDEVFGPVLAITPFDTEAEAIALSNDSRYGLAAFVHTDDTARARRFAGALDVGMVEINGCTRPPGAPFGGRKASGLGSEGGLWGIRAFQRVKSVSGLAAGGR